VKIFALPQWGDLRKYCSFLVPDLAEKPNMQFPAPGREKPKPLFSGNPPLVTVTSCSTPNLHLEMPLPLKYIGGEYIQCYQFKRIKINLKKITSSSKLNI
jgi:hypothetical protein